MAKAKEAKEKTVPSAKDQKELPGMEDAAIADLEEKAHEYKKILNKRQDLTRREVELKSDLINLMHKHKKKEYVRDGIEIRLVAEAESVKVKIKTEEGEGDE